MTNARLWVTRLWLSSTALLGPVGLAYADNPIIQTKFTANPAPLVFDGRLYLYTTHDDDDATGFTMYDWMLYSTTDMVNWTDHGIVASVKARPRPSRGPMAITRGRRRPSIEMASSTSTVLW